MGGPRLKWSVPSPCSRFHTDLRGILQLQAHTFWEFFFILFFLPGLNAQRESRSGWTVTCPTDAVPRLSGLGTRDAALSRNWVAEQGPAWRGWWRNLKTHPALQGPKTKLRGVKAWWWGPAFLSRTCEERVKQQGKKRLFLSPECAGKQSASEGKRQPYTSFLLVKTRFQLLL